MKTNFPFILFIFLLGCASSQSSSPSNSTWHKDYKNEIVDQTDFDSLAGEPLSSKYDDILSVKVIWNLKDDQIYFISSKFFKYHHEFTDKYFDSWMSVQAFNATNYHTNFMQNFCLGNLNFSLQNNSYSLELSTTASYQPQQINQFFEKVQLVLKCNSNFKFLVNSDHLLNIEEQLDIPKISVSDFFGNQPFQIIQPGKTYGRLVLLENEKDYYKIKTTDIVVVHGSPTSIPLCKAIISDQVQSPLSHIQLLSRNRKTPSLSISSPRLYAELISHLNQVIELNVGNDDYTITLSDLTLVENDFVRPEKTTRLEFDDRKAQLLFDKSLALSNKSQIGNKAAGFGELQKMSRAHNALFSTPEDAFGIPFYFFTQHIQDPQLQTLLLELMKIERPYADSTTAPLLKKIRTRIKAIPLSTDLLQMVNAQLSNSPNKKFRFRSSCNAEDLKDFNGAGLYTSKSAIVGDSIKTVEKAIKEVWASLYNDQAYIERWSKNIDESTVKMGVLVHRSFPDEKINGVILSSNIYRKNSPGITVNLQLGENKVVSPKDNTISEQCVISDKGMFIDQEQSKTIDFISFSSESPNAPLLTKKEYTLLYDAVYQIKTKLYFKNYGHHSIDFNDYSLDLEFKFDENGKLYIKQVRPA